MRHFKLTRTFFALACCLLLASFAAPGVQAFEVLAAQYVVEEEVPEDAFVMTTDNFLILFDSSSSMNAKYEDTGKTRIQIAKEILKERNMALPELDWIAGLYTYAPTGNTFSKSILTPYYEMAPYNRAAFGKAIDSLPEAGAGPTMLQKALVQVEDVLKGLSGKTTIFLFTDGTYTTMGSKGIQTSPVDLAKGLAAKYDVCFYVISGAKQKLEKEIVKQVSTINACSRAITFETMVSRPENLAGSLYVVDQVIRVSETVVTKVVAVKIKDILFPFDSAALGSEYDTELGKLADFMKSKPDSFVVVAGFTDSIGSAEYNLGLSRRRADSVAGYLADTLGIDPSRIVLQWYGAADPVASNDTAEGRALNRRAVIVLSGLN